MAAEPNYFPRVYKDVNCTRPDDFWNFENYPVTYGKRKQYELVELLQNDWSTGVVFRGYNKTNNDKIAVKLFTEYRVSKSHFENSFREELKIMKELQDSPNVVKLLDLLKDHMGVNTRSYVFEYINFTPSEELFPVLTADDVQFYAFEVFKTLDFVHSKGIIHQGIKPDNILIDHNKRLVKLIDFGISKFYRPENKHCMSFSGNAGYKAPEVILEIIHHYAIDLWSMGVVFAEMIFKKIPFFQLKSYDNLMSVISVLGKDDLVTYGMKYRKSVYYYVEVHDLRTKTLRRKDLKCFATDQNKHTATDEAVDLLEHLLLYDHDDRYTAQEAMAHPYFCKERERRENAAETKSITSTTEQERISQVPEGELNETVNVQPQNTKSTLVLNQGQNTNNVSDSSKPTEQKENIVNNDTKVVTGEIEMDTEKVLDHDDNKHNMVDEHCKDCPKRGLASKSNSIEIKIPLKKPKNQEALPQNNAECAAAEICESLANHSISVASGDNEGGVARDKQQDEPTGDGAEDATQAVDIKNETVNEAGAASK